MYVINESCRISHMDESRHISIRHIVYKCAISNVCHVSRFKKKCHIPRSQISSMSRCNVCHQWVMWYITHGRVTSHMNESRHIWMGHVTYEWVTSYMNGSRHIWMSHTKCMSSVTFQMYALCHISSVCHTNVTYGCLIPSVCHVSRFKCMLYVTYQVYVIQTSHMDVSYQVYVMCHVSNVCHMSHIKCMSYKRHIWMSHTKCMSCVTFFFREAEKVMSQSHKYKVYPTLLTHQSDRTCKLLPALWVRPGFA